MPEYLQWSLVGGGLLLFVWMASGGASDDDDESEDRPQRKRRRFHRWRPRRRISPALRRRLHTARRQTSEISPQVTEHPDEAVQYGKEVHHG